MRVILLSVLIAVGLVATPTVTFEFGGPPTESPPFFIDKKPPVVIDRTVTTTSIANGLSAIAEKFALSLDEFNKACATKGGIGGPEHFQNFLVQFIIGKFTNKAEAVKFLAHVIWETNGLTDFEEEFCTIPANLNACRQKYGTGPNGVIYYGRGCLLISGMENYKQFSMFEFTNDTGIRLLEDPGQVSTVPSTAWDSAGWFWRDQVHNANATGTFGQTLKVISPQDCKSSGSNPQNNDLRCQHYQQIRSITDGYVIRNPDDVCDC